MRIPDTYLSKVWVLSDENVNRHSSPFRLAQTQFIILWLRAASKHDTIGTVTLHFFAIFQH